MALRNLSVNPDNESKMVEEGGLPPLLAMLRSDDEVIQLQAAVAIRNLSFSPENEVSVVCVCVCVCV